MKDAAELAEVRLPDAAGNETRLGDLWSERPAVLVWLRHYGCPFCRQYIARLAERYGEFESRDIALVAIGMGDPREATDFLGGRDVPFPLLVDGGQETYRKLELTRSFLGSNGPKVWFKALQAAVFEGNKMSVAKQDQSQLGGAMAVAPGGQIKYLHRARNSADNAPIDDLLAALTAETAS